MEIGVCSAIGKIRELNEDFYFASKPEDQIKLFIVADGMGGHNAGEVASFMAVNFIKDFFYSNYPLLEKNEENIESFIREAILMANSYIFEQARTNISYNGMGTTLTLLLVEKDRFYIGHLGDSRAYLIRNDNIIQLTEDHTLMTELIKKGNITKEEAKFHPQRHIITRALGTNYDVLIDTYKDKLYDGDIIILCTDGLSNMVEDYEICEEIVREKDIQKSCLNLMHLANSRGGYDNITIIAVKV